MLNDAGVETAAPRRLFGVVGYAMNAIRESLRPLVLGSRSSIAGSVYGAIVVMGTITAGSAGGTMGPWQLASVTAATVVVLWLAHVYAHGLGESLEQGHTVTRAELTSIARRESSIPLAATGPVLALVLGALGVLEDSTAGWVALGIGVLASACRDCVRRASAWAGRDPSSRSRSTSPSAS
jgi:hypothetical protein